jgi:hypothetical protein
MANRINGIEMSPCLCAKVKFALGIKNHYTGNLATCSQERWNFLVEHFGNLNNISKVDMGKVKQRKDLFRNA